MQSLKIEIKPQSKNSLFYGCCQHKFKGGGESESKK